VLPRLILKRVAENASDALSLKKAPLGCFLDKSPVLTHSFQLNLQVFPLIIEAFAKYLQSADPEQSAVSVLVRWLWERLTLPAQNNVDRVIKHEVRIERMEETEEQEKENADKESRFTFVALSSSGSRLLKSLYEYAMSYEQQKWARWVHCIKASDFKTVRKE
jgi:hypothetical protein